MGPLLEGPAVSFESRANLSGAGMEELVMFLDCLFRMFSLFWEKFP